MQTNSPSPRLIAACGLYCGTCRRYHSGKCPGCTGNDKASWCKVRSCTHEQGWATCAECPLTTAEACPKLHSIISKFFKLIFRSDREGCLARIREIGAEAFAREMHLAKSYNRPINHRS